MTNWVGLGAGYVTLLIFWDFVSRTNKKWVSEKLNIAERKGYAKTQGSSFR